jgi:signal transduction histidine kinase
VVVILKQLTAMFPRLSFLFYEDTIMSKNNILVVPDASVDFRFHDNPMVTAAPNFRFYAGAPLMSPEGYKLGTLCILDAVARPNGLSPEQSSTLIDLADMTVKVMVDRRFKIQRREAPDPADLIAYTAHDLMTPLTGIQLSLSILKEDEGVKAALGAPQMELLNAAVRSSHLMTRICQNALDGLSQSDKTADAVIENHQESITHPPGSDDDILVTNMVDLVKSLRVIVDPIPKKVPCIITLDHAVPETIVGDDLKLFRSALNLLTNALDRTSRGTVHLTIRPHQDSLLLFECEDTGADIPVDEYQYLFPAGCRGESNSRVGLSSIASLIKSLDGEYGFRPRGIDADGNILTDSEGCRRSGSIFWFSIPLYAAAAQPKSAKRHCTNGISIQMSQFPHQLPEAPVNAAAIQPAFAAAGGGILYNAGVMTGFESSSEFGSGGNSSKSSASLLMAQPNIPGAKMMEKESTLPAIMDEWADLEPFPIEGLAAGDVAGVRRRRVLIIDDSLVVRRSLGQAFNNLGFDVTHANDGIEGLKELQRTLFDMVLVDFLMPAMGGPE